ncbi:hypothetical protein AHAS_Ahas13G0355300 [Arachis hypogaea]
MLSETERKQVDKEKSHKQKETKADLACYIQRKIQKPNGKELKNKGNKRKTHKEKERRNSKTKARQKHNQNKNKVKRAFSQLKKVNHNHHEENWMEEKSSTPSFMEEGIEPSNQNQQKEGRPPDLMEADIIKKEDRVMDSLEKKPSMRLIEGVDYTTPDMRSRYTWRGPQWEGQDRVFKRLDRTLANHSWRTRFHEAIVEVLAKTNSDHHPLLIRNERERIKRRILNRISGIQRSRSYGNNQYLDKLEQDLNKELEDVLDKEETFWMQKSRQQGIVKGDRNTKYYHTKTVIRRRRNKIQKLRRTDGSWIEEDDELKDHIINHFQSIYQEQEISNLSGFKEQKDLGRYLGALITNNGRLRLAQTILNPVLNYNMQHERISKRIFLEVEKIQRSFIWGEEPNQRRMHLIGWKILCQPKHLEGLGFRKLSTMNDAFMLKIIWQAMENLEALWVRVLSHKYCNRRRLNNNANYKLTNSSLWKELKKIWLVFQEHSVHYVSNGLSTYFWKDQWVEREGILIEKAINPINVDLDSFVWEWTSTNGEWDLEKLRLHLPQHNIQKSLKLARKGKNYLDRAMELEGTSASKSFRLDSYAQ